MELLSLRKGHINYGVFLFCLLVLLVPLAWFVAQLLQYTNGLFMYPYDDTFIHLTIAKHFAKGTWGVNDSAFASASSSPLYTVILAVFCLFSGSYLIPLVVNVLAGLLIVFAVLRWLQKQQVSAKAQGAIFLLAAFFTPLSLLIISGMEHTLQCLFSFLFIFYFSAWLEKAKVQNRWQLPAVIFVLAILVATVRYEGLFLVAIACLLLLAQKQPGAAFLLGGVAAAPLVIFGLISLSKGSYFLPNSVLVKSGSFSHGGIFSTIGEIFFNKLIFDNRETAALATQRLLIAIPVLYFVFRKHLKPGYFFILVFLMGATILQLAFASTGYLYRYEAYLFFCFFIIAPVLFYKYGRLVFSSTLSGFPAKAAAIVLAFFLFFPVALRSSSALAKTKQGCINIFDQQFQMARFVKQYYNHSAVALNDIGAVSFFTSAKIVDLWGLANIEVTKSKKEHYWTPGFLNKLCQNNNVQLAMIYDVWFPEALTNKWQKVATWQIQNNVICGDDAVSFYALDAQQAPVLLQQLKAFEASLPRSVIVKY